MLGVGAFGPLGPTPGARRHVVREARGGVTPANPANRSDRPASRAPAEARDGVAGASRAAPEQSELAEERQAWIVLATVDGVGERTLAGLVAAHGSARRALWLAGRGRLGRVLGEATGGRRAVIPAATVAGIERAAREPGARLSALAARSVWTLTLLDPDYPRRLLTLLSPPPVLFGQGDARALEAPRAVAVVGTRRASPGGRWQAARAGAGFAARGVTVVSGLALGIDGAAHAAALEAGGETIAAIGSGHAHPGPAAHRGLAERIRQGGAVIGELPPEAHASRGTYPRRNRLIVALADAVVVVEAPARSGALITAHLALEQGVPLFVVPGSDGSERSAGCRALLDEASAWPFGDATSLCDAMGWRAAADDASQTAGGRASWSCAAASQAARRREDGNHVAVGQAPGGRADWRRAATEILPELGAAEREVARLLARGPATMDELLAATGAAPGELAATLTLLQLRDVARTLGPLYLPAGPLLLDGP